AASIGLGTLASIGIAGLSIGTSPSFNQSIDRTGANSRGQIFVDPNAMGVYCFGRTALPSAVVYEQLHGINEDRITNVMAHAWHEIEGYVSLAVDGEAVSFSGDNATGAWAGLVEWRRRTGAAGQTYITVPEITGGE